MKGTPYKWLNVASMCDSLLPEFEVVQVKYFTAKVKQTPHDLSKNTRQQIYFRALRTDSRIELVYGAFESRVRQYPEHPWRYEDDGKVALHKVRFMQEKGSDVNLAAHMLTDAFNRQADAYIVITNDSDQETPLRLLVQQQLGLVGLLAPDKAPVQALMNLKLDLYKHIRLGALESNQFPNELVDEVGVFSKPKSW